MASDPTHLTARAWDLVLDAANERNLDSLPQRARQLMNETAAVGGNPTPYPQERS